jgi:anti-sigma regulatory factor (Ser/Thr protein kinase)
MPAHLKIELPRSERAPALARAALLDLDDPPSDVVLADLRLLVSELVTNSVKYGGDGPVRLEVSRAGGRVRAEIANGGACFVPRVRERELEDVGGWGLHLVERLSERWGAGEHSACVWFEIASLRDAQRSRGGGAVSDAP